MLLDERKYKILEAIVNDYIQTAEPIGSRTIAKKYEMGISSATIRNEMSDLEEMGFIKQPHTSSGRIPSDKGYRLYVDRMMRHRMLTEDETMFLQRTIINNINQIEYMMQETAKAVAYLTHYPAIVSEPYIKKTKVRHVQLVPIDEKTVLLVLVTDVKAVRNQVIPLAKAPGNEDLARLSGILNKYLVDKTIKDISREIVDKMLASFGPQAYVLMPVLGVIVDIMKSEDDVRIFTSGVKNILAFPEFSDIRKASAIFHALEERDILVSILSAEQNERIQIIIGAENTLEPLQDCSIIKANYSFDNQRTGCIGVIGPTRMDYAQTVSILDEILQNISAVIKALSGN